VKRHQTKALGSDAKGFFFACSESLHGLHSEQRERTVWTLRV